MKKNIILTLLVCISFLTGKAQNKYQLVDNFDDNRNGWTEFVSKKAKAVIQEEVLLIESKDKKEFAYHSHLGGIIKRQF